MSKKTSAASSPLTFDMPASIKAKIASKTGKGITQSAVIRHALDSFDFRTYTPSQEEHTQVSVRIDEAKKKVLVRFAKAKGVSIGELLRAAIECMPAMPKAAAPKKAKKK